MLGMLLAYDAAGNVVATLDYMVARDERSDVSGLVNFVAHELAGGELTDVWRVDGAKGSKTWPEWLGGRACEFRVELDGPPGRKRIVALVHRVSGHRRVRADVDSAITQRIAAVAQPADIRDLVGGPDRPLVLDDAGRSFGRARTGGATPAQLPVVRSAPGREGAIQGHAAADAGDI